MFSYNYHTHTKRCGHAEGEDREYVEAAIQAGYEILGFSDHCPWIFPDGYVSGIRLLPNEVDEYFDSLTSLRKEYEKDIKIFIGFEAEYDPNLTASQMEFLSDYPLDYLIMGQHFLGSEPGSTYAGTPTSDEAILKKYVSIVMEGLETGNYLYLAHPDLIHYTGPDEIYKLHMKKLCEYLKAKNIPVEINMLGAFQGRHYPCDKFLQIVQEVGNTCIVGVDAHEPAQLMNEYGNQVCEEIIQKYGFTLSEPLLK